MSNQKLFCQYCRLVGRLLESMYVWTIMYLISNYEGCPYSTISQTILGVLDSNIKQTSHIIQNFVSNINWWLWKIVQLPIVIVKLEFSSTNVFKIWGGKNTWGKLCYRSLFKKLWPCSRVNSFHFTTLFKAEWGFMFQEQSFRECKLWGADTVLGQICPWANFALNCVYFPSNDYLHHNADNSLLSKP